MLEFVKFLAWNQANQKMADAGIRDDPILSVMGILPGKPLTKKDAIEERSETVSMMSLAETGFTERNEEGEGIYDL